MYFVSEQVRLVSVKAEHPNHPSHSHARQRGGQPVGVGVVVGVPVVEGSGWGWGNPGEFVNLNCAPRVWRTKQHQPQTWFLVFVCFQGKLRFHLQGCQKLKQSTASKTFLCVRTTHENPLRSTNVTPTLLGSERPRMTTWETPQPKPKFPGSGRRGNWKRLGMDFCFFSWRYCPFLPGKTTW